MTGRYRAPGLADSVGVTCVGGPVGTAAAVPAFAQPPPAAPAPDVGHDTAPSLDTAHDGGIGVGHRGAVCGSMPDGAPGGGAMHGVGTGHTGATCGSTPDGAPGAGTPHGGGIGQACSTAGVAGTGSTHGSGGGQAVATCSSMPDGAPGCGRSRMHGGGSGQGGIGCIMTRTHGGHGGTGCTPLSGVRVAGRSGVAHHGGRQVVLPPAGPCTQMYGPAGRAPG